LEALKGIFRGSHNKNIPKDTLLPVYIFDRSYGGDAVLSNIPKKELFTKNYEYINVFMERDSINELLFEGLKKLKEWKDTQFRIHNINQYNLANLDFDLDRQVPNLVITYEPYLTRLKKKGFTLVESTKNDKLLVFDFLSIKEGLLNDEQIKKLQEILKRSENELKKDARSFYNVVGLYFEGLGFEEFKAALEGIKLNSDKDINKQMISFIEKEKVTGLLKYIKREY
jgi:hypothetical protein